MQVYLKGIFVVLSSVVLTYQERLPLFGKNCQIEIGIKKHLKRVSFLLRWVIFRFLFCSFVLPKGGATRYTSALLHNRTRKIKAFLSYFFFCMVITIHFALSSEPKGDAPQCRVVIGLFSYLLHQSILVHIHLLCCFVVLVYLSCLNDKVMSLACYIRLSYTLLF